MSYRLTVDFAPAYELVASLDAFLFGQVKLLEMGAAWNDEVRARLGTEQVAALAIADDVEILVLYLLVRQAPAPRDAESFLAWYAGLSPGQLYERIEPYLPDDATQLLRNLDDLKARHLRALRVWLDQYFRHLDPGVIERLAAEADYRRESAAGVAPVAAIDAATTGVVVESEMLDEVLLVPQYHYRPLNRYEKGGRLLVCLYPVESPSSGPGQPTTDLMRLTRALGDENRLRILHYLAGGPPRSFTEVQRFIGLAKNTVHHHLTTLRAAGLVRIHLTGECGSDRYTARRATLDEIGPRLQGFLDQR